ncbi:TetR/AcrR family transcriptional regulator [Salinibacterium sp. PAMC 21357]|uniref:TetR/AcrR family transcriptional regulator n=1 Tax=Salinibacterium sp. PAMC 21357 TaxID=1112215 RepID=UPI0002883B4B|nr:TetR/AcrR family transcriptional regulator [Salinibacterium sp. PAMC 21357]
MKDEPLPRSQQKRNAIVRAAEELFLRDGYLGTSMDELAQLSGVSKQTVYKHFGSKEALFVELVTSMTAGAGGGIEGPENLPTVASEVWPYLERHAIDELTIVLTPRLLRLRRLVIGEVGRFPALATALYENGPLREIHSLSETFSTLAERKLLVISDPLQSAATFNWLVMGAPVNEAMLLGDDAVADPERLHRHAKEAVRVFLASHR